MRILHTADWHLGDRLGRIDRTDDLRKAVERVADYCKQENVDVLLVAGDLFSELARPDGLRETIRHWQSVFSPFLESGGTILTLTGNHDNENFCQTLVSAMSLASPTVGKPGETVPPGRLYLAADPTFIRLEDRMRGFPVQFVLMPYPTPHRFLRGETGLKYGSPEEKNALLVSAWADALREIRAHPKYDLKAPSVLGAHVHVHGSTIGPSLFRITVEEDVVVEGAELPNQFDYVALGHIHKPQWLGAEHMRYCGSIERLDLGEQADQKGVILVDIGPDGRNGEPVVLPLQATPIYEVVVLDPAEDIPRLRAEYPSANNDLVNLQIRYTAGKDQLEDVLRDLDKIFPRWYARDWKETGALGPTLVSPATGGGKGFGETVHEYLTQELIQHDEAERDAILKIADGLLKEMES
ncbi:Nuclease SbcCD subunit D [Gemmata sp. SH-PL17]|uniref:metallophosphoesterase family protein n=1 Tax=Gemmata sp. SH-PL17 TaxID=1630693 RepID=UPI0004B11126|nr:exonuclease subunit SbcD [Gemmata sp. SH-PL17]AMV27021.1 Nuclease SbcCD subunit D [Gemmata sp. SH-PL17]